MAQLRPRGDAHAPQGCLVQRRFQAIKIIAQTAAVERSRADRAPAGGGIGAVAVEVGHAIAVDELQGGLAPEKVDHARTVFEKGAGALVIEPVAQFVAQIGQRLFERLDNSALDSQRIARNPHPAARPCGCAAKGGVFFRYNHCEAQMRRRHRRRQSARTGADHQQVAIAYGGACPAHLKGHRSVCGRRGGAVARSRRSVGRRATHRSGLPAVGLSPANPVRGCPSALG